MKKQKIELFDSQASGGDLPGIAVNFHPGVDDTVIHQFGEAVFKFHPADKLTLPGIDIEKIV